MENQSKNINQSKSIKFDKFDFVLIYLNINQFINIESNLNKSKCLKREYGDMTEGHGKNKIRGDKSLEGSACKFISDFVHPSSYIPEEFTNSINQSKIFFLIVVIRCIQVYSLSIYLRILSYISKTSSVWMMMDVQKEYHKRRTL
jgi:hypothetical protein